jgi:hypothetical protein
LPSPTSTFLPPGFASAAAHFATGLRGGRSPPSVGELHLDHLVEKMALDFGAEGAVGDCHLLNWHPLLIDHIQFHVDPHRCSVKWNAPRFSGLSLIMP